MRRRVRIVTWFVVAAVVVGAAAAAFVASGVYNIAAVEQHTAPVYWALYAAMRQSVRHHAADITPPPLDDAKRVKRGRTLYDAHCRQCHGAPGVAPEPFALGLTPTPLNLANMAREWPARDLFWVVKNGIKMSAMPAWEFRLPEQDLWAVVAYLKALPAESPAQYRDAMAVRPDRPVAPRDALTPRDGDPASRERGKTALSQYGCATCHDIPGVVGAAAPVGPPLAAISRRGAIAGLLANDLPGMLQWIREPQDVHPGSAMPDLGVTARDARDMAAYLYSLR
jgi:mono/diheme cytochrome c family protein